MTLDLQDFVRESLGLKDPLLIEKPSCRPNIFLECHEFTRNDWKWIFDDIIDDLLENKERAARHLIYTRTKAEAVQYSAYVAAAIGQNFGLTGGVRRVNLIHRDLDDDDKEAITLDFCKVWSQCRVLFASVVLGMGIHMCGLYRVWRIGQPITLLAWVQEFGRAGRDGLAAKAILFFSREMGFGMDACMKAFVNLKTCKQLQIAWHFDKSIEEQTVRAQEAVLQESHSGPLSRAQR